MEADEVYIVAGHKGQPTKVAKSGREPRRRRLKGHRGRGTSASEKPPVLGLVQRDGSLVLRALDNVRQVTIRPVIEQSIRSGTLIYTDEYNIYDRLEEWGFKRKSVCHANGDMLGMRTKTDSVRSMLTPRKESGRSSRPG